MQISNRLKTVASMVSQGYRVADIGTDHAYVPIYLVQEGKCPGALAMDIGKGPLERAEEHIRAYGLTEQIKVRLSDGLTEYMQGEADSIVIAGMGGSLMARILTVGAEKLAGVKELILSPQSEIFLVREWLWASGWQIEYETMLSEDEKYYTVMRAVPGKMRELKPVEACYGRYLLESQNEVLWDFLKKEKDTIFGILAVIEKEDGEHIKSRKMELADKLQRIEEALSYYEMRGTDSFSGRQDTAEICGKLG